MAVLWIADPRVGGSIPPLPSLFFTLSPPLWAAPLGLLGVFYPAVYAALKSVCVHERE